jgi:PKHD-type hydroxylase
MLITLKSVIDPEQLNIIQQAVTHAAYVDGKSSAGKTAAKVKNNQEIDQQSEMGQQLAQVIIGNLSHHEDFKSAALPLRIASPYVAKYSKGMTYGYHIDDPVMGKEQRFRCDLACTIFLNSPEDYAGGELSIKTQFGEKQVKLSAGDAVLYPASSLHKVNEISNGERIVAVTWIQSLIRDPAQREILYDLSKARDKLMTEQPDNEVTKQVDHSYTNLVRMWSEV